MTKAKPPNYNVDRLVDPTIQKQYQEAVSVRLAELDEEGLTTGKEIWTQVIDIVKEAAVETIGISKKGGNNKAIPDKQVTEWSQQQRKLFLDFRSCENTETCKEIKSKRNQLLKLIRDRI